MIYVSTSCLRNPINVIRVLQEYEKANIENVELGSVHNFFDVKKLKQFNFNFIVHNYFPPPKTKLIFNLASQNKSILKRSIKLAKDAINLCCDIESPLYTFHAGFTTDPKKLGVRFSQKNILKKETSLKIFVDSVSDVIDYAKNRGIKIAMEPNVVQKFNLTNNKNELLLFADYDEIKQFYKIFKKKDIGILLDLGHTAVTSYWLNFDKNKFVKLCLDKTFAVHVSNNNGRQDQHNSLTKKCWQTSKLKLFKDVPISLETMNLDISQIQKNMKIANSAIT
ncbi:putative endonuclease 4 protein [Marine Group I thaumarchaeote SCGC AAA799-P11]|uniref:Putative endonuclease 4 protein n=1 Tax=Marine Group I thaumarchaeote SCGC AAA799-P11 TaxID=1502295 RepID=A0A087S308_9ARCH|nr:putative endonuclease 4 protein [Marine Group I thaumarchaeote SCGC AAA799-P11]